MSGADFGGTGRRKGRLPDLDRLEGVGCRDGAAGGYAAGDEGPGLGVSVRSCRSRE